MAWLDALYLKDLTTSCSRSVDALATMLIITCRISLVTRRNDLSR